MHEISSPGGNAFWDGSTRDKTKEGCYIWEGILKPKTNNFFTESSWCRIRGIETYKLKTKKPGNYWKARPIAFFDINNDSL